jgi:hypothetical protein
MFDVDRTLPDDWPTADSEAIFFAVTNPSVPDRGIGFFVLERSFQRARWINDEQTALAIHSWMAQIMVVRIDAQA